MIGIEPGGSAERDSFLSAVGRKSVAEHTLPDGSTVHYLSRAATVAPYLTLFAVKGDNATAEEISDMRWFSVRGSLCDSDGNLILTDKDREACEQDSSGILDSIFRAVVDSFSPTAQR